MPLFLGKRGYSIPRTLLFDLCPRTRGNKEHWEWSPDKIIGVLSLSKTEITVSNWLWDKRDPHFEVSFRGKKCGVFLNYQVRYIDPLIQDPTYIKININRDELIFKGGILEFMKSKIMLV